MPVLHYHVSILTIPSAKIASEMRKNSVISRSVISELDETHWMVESRNIPDIEKQCARLNIQIKVIVHGSQAV